MDDDALRRAWRYYHLGRDVDALGAARCAVAEAPASKEAEYALALILLRSGQMGEGWAHYEARKFVPHTRIRPPPGKEWAGESLKDRDVLVWPEQGLGDQIMASRYLSSLRNLGANPAIIAPQPLAALFEAMGWTVIPQGGAVAISASAVSSLCLSLPRHLDIPAPIAPGVRPRRYNGRIGIMTSGNPAHPNDPNRSLPPDLAATLLAVPGAVNLAPEQTGAQTFLDTAEIVAGLDCVVTVDTSVAHLAGTLGKPVWILLPALGLDWRWQTDRIDSPWYPTVRLVRQRTPGDWQEAVETVLHEVC
jgi:hypothetical protein